MLDIRFLITLLFTVCLCTLQVDRNSVVAADINNSTGVTLSGSSLAQQVIIHRDEWGVAHLFGETDKSTLFGVGYAQAEDYFWQLEDTTIQAIGRYAEIRGKNGLKTDLLARSFELAGRSQRDFAKLPSESQELLQAFAAGVNYFLEVDSTVKPRLLERFEAWHVLAIDRYLMLTMTYGGSGARKPRPQDAKLSLQDQDFPRYSWDWVDPPNQLETNPLSRLTKVLPLKSLFILRTMIKPLNTVTKRLLFPRYFHF